MLMKKVLYSFLAVLLLLVISTLAMGYKMAKVATVPDYNYGQNYDTAFAMVYRAYPEMKPWYDSLVENGFVRDTFLTNAEGLRLHGILMEHPETDSIPVTSAVMLIHGYCDDAPVMMRYTYCDYEVLHQNVFLPERRWCGKSEGDHITFGHLDCQDMHLWLEMMHDLWQKPIFVHGLSMGATTTMLLSGDSIDDRLKVRGFIEDCGYSTTWDLLAHQIVEDNDLPVFPTLYAASLINRIWHGWWFSDGNAIEQVRKCTRPMLFIHGKDDKLVPFKMVYDVFRAKRGKKTLWEVPDTGHAKSIHKHWNDYCKCVGDFIKDALSNQE